VGYGLMRRQKPGRYQDPGTFTSSYKTKLVIGAPMVTKVALELVPGQQKSYPYPTMQSVSTRWVLSSSRNLGTVRAGTLCIYSGTVRVKERARVAYEKVDIEVPKHTFIIPNVGRVIIHDLGLMGHA
jgi:hypothetical protein